MVKQRQINQRPKSGQLLPCVGGLSSKGCFPWLHLSLVTFPKWCCTQRNWGSDQEISQWQGWTHRVSCKGLFFAFFPPAFPKEGHGMRQISWEMSQCCLLLQGLAAFAARVTVSDTSCHFQCSLLVPESVPAILPQERLLHSLMKRGNNSKANLIHHTWVREIKSQTTDLTVEVCLEIF